MSDRGIRLARAELVALCNEVEEGRALGQRSAGVALTAFRTFPDHQVIFSDHAYTILHLKRNISLRLLA